MIKLQDTIIQVDTQDMLNTLKSELYSRGIERFNLFRPNGENIQTNCPFHKNGQERKPSFGINGDLNKCHCFACGWSGGIDNMISELFGYNDEGKYGKRWLIKRFNTIEIGSRPNILSNFEKRNIKQNTQSQAYITEEELDKYRYIHPYHYERGLTDEIIDMFDIGYDCDSNCITFPVKDDKGRTVFVARRAVHAKFFNYPSETNKPVYLAYMFTGGKYKRAWIVESFLNCLTCWKYGIPAMAMIGTGADSQYRILEQLPVREYVLAFDNDEAGIKATERFRRNVKGKLIKEVKYNRGDTRDINDLQEEVKNLKIIL